MCVNVYLPPGWPDGVRPPGSDRWLDSATAFLFDCCPADFRSYSVLHRHPVILARFAARFVDAQSEAATAGLAEIRVSLRDLVADGLLDREAVEAAAAAWQHQQARLVRTARGVRLVEQAIRGREFVRQL